MLFPLRLAASLSWLSFSLAAAAKTPHVCGTINSAWVVLVISHEKEGFPLELRDGVRARIGELRSLGLNITKLPSLQPSAVEPRKPSANHFAYVSVMPESSSRIIRVRRPCPATAASGTAKFDINLTVERSLGLEPHQAIVTYYILTHFWDKDNPCLSSMTWQQADEIRRILPSYFAGWKEFDRNRWATFSRETEASVRQQTRIAINSRLRLCDKLTGLKI